MAKAIKQALIAAVIVFAVVATMGAAGIAVTGVTIGSLSVAASMAVLTFATTLVAAGIGMMTSKGIEANQANFGTKTSTRGAIHARQVIYGLSRVGSTITFMRTTGTDNNKLSMVFVLAGHEIEELVSINLNETTATTTSATSSGAGTDDKIHTVTNSDFTNTDNDNNFGSGRLIRFTINDGSQTSYDALARTTHGSTVIDDNFKLKTCAYVYMEMIYDSEKMPSVPKITFLVKGKKIYDPRLDSTVGGSGSHRLGTASTYAWTDNPALCLLDYLADTTHGIKATSDELNLTANAGGFMSAANTCEQSVTLGGVTEERYTANGFTNMSANGLGICEGLLSSCGGKMTFTNGKFNIFVAATQTPSLTITDDEILAPIDITKNTQSNELFNSVKSLFVDKNNNYVGTDSPEITSSTFLTEDTPSGESNLNYKKRMEVQLPYTNTVTTAERLSKIALQHQRKTLQVSLLVTTKYLRVQPCDFVYITNERLSWTSKMFEVMSTQLEFGMQENSEIPVAMVRLVVKEIDAATYDFASNEYVTPITQGAVSEVPTGDYTVSAPTSLAAAQILVKDGTSSKVNIKATWTNSTSPYLFGTEVAYKLNGEADSLYRSITVGAGTSTAYLPNVSIGETYNVKARHVSQRGVYSDYTSAVNVTITAASGAPDAPSSLSASTSKALNIIITYTNPNNSDLKAVKIYRKTSNSAPSSDSDGLVHTQYGAPNAVSTWLDGLHNGLTAGTTYYYWVKAINHSDVNSSYTGSASGNFTAVKTADIEDDLITAAKIADDAVLTAAIANDQVTNALIATDAVNSDSIVANAVTATEILAGTITTTEIASTTIVAGNIASGTITATQIAADTITASNMAADSITATEIDVSTLSAISANMGTITAGSITAGSVAATTLNLNGTSLTASASGLKLNNHDVFAFANSGSIGTINGTGGNDVQMTSVNNHSSSLFLDTAPFHISDTTTTSTDPDVTAGNVMGGLTANANGPVLFSFNFTTAAFSGTKKFIVMVHVNPVGSFGSQSESMFSFAMRATSSSTAYTSATASDYVTTRGTSIGGSNSGAPYLLTDIVSLSGSTEYYVWVFGGLDDVSGAGHTIGQGIIDGTITVTGLNA